MLSTNSSLREAIHSSGAARCSDETAWFTYPLHQRNAEVGDVLFRV